MKKYWQVVGIAAVGAALLYYPTLKLLQYLKSRSQGNGRADQGDHHAVKAFFSPAYRGKHKPHHRSAHNGHSNPDQA